jgi:hypothetical protein
MKLPRSGLYFSTGRRGAKKGKEMKRSLILPAAAIIALIVPALAAQTAATKAGKKKPCPKGTVATTSKITGDQHCFAMAGVTTVGGPQPVLIPEKAVKKPKP